MAGSWTDEEVFKLIQLWGDDTIQAKLEGCKQNKDVYENIARGMREAGYARTTEQCREKVKKLKAEYCKIKDGHNQTGTERKHGRFLDALDNVLGDKPSTHPPVVVDTLENDDEASSSIANACSAVIDEEDAAGPSNKSDCSSRPSIPAQQERKRGKRSREERLERVIKGVMEQLTTAQQESDERFILLEEKKLKLEEKQMEREERERREEREFKLRMMQMWMHGLSPHPSQVFAPHPQYPKFPRRRSV